jgi:hypothetical protein
MLVGSEPKCQWLELISLTNGSRITRGQPMIIICGGPRGVSPRTQAGIKISELDARL